MDLEKTDFQTKNPLLLTPVLLSLAKHLRHPELKSCRLVCSTWACTFKSKFVSTSKVTLESSASEFIEVNYLHKYITTRKQMFFTSLVLRMTEVTDPILYLLKLCSSLNTLTELHLEDRFDKLEISFLRMLRIFKQFGPNLVKLTIVLPYAYYPIKKLNSDSSILFPKLNSLKLICNPYTRNCPPFFDHNGNQLFLFFTELFGNLPQLKQLTLHTEGQSGPAPALEALYNAPCAPNLTLLDAYGDTDLVALRMLKALTQKAKNLKKFKLFFWVKVEDEAACRSALCDLLECDGDVLEDFYNPGQGYGGYIYTPQDKEWFFQKEHFIANKYISVDVGQLEGLLCSYIGQIHLGTLDQQDNEIQIKTGAETKIELCTDGDYELIGALYRSFPETKSLTGIITCGYAELWRWTTLTTLDITIKPNEDDHNVNSHFLGITTAVLKYLEKNLSPNRAKDFVLATSGLSILNLRNLKVLRMEFRGSYSLDATGYFAFANMSWLDELAITGSPNSLSYYCAEYIRNRLEKTIVLIARNRQG